MRNKKHLLIVLISISFVTSFSQSINFKRYGIQEGIPHPTVYNLIQDKNNRLWLGTGSGICWFDGTRFEKGTSADTLPAGYASASFRDSYGNTWFGYDDGSIFVIKGRKIVKALSNVETPSVITSFAQSGNLVIAATQNNGVFCFAENNKVTHVKKGFENQLLYSLYATENNYLLAGCDSGLFIYKLGVESAEQISKVEGVPSTKIQCICKGRNDNTIWVGTEDEGFFKLVLNNNSLSKPQVVNLALQFNLITANVSNILEDASMSLWVCTFGSGVYKLSYNNGMYLNATNYNQENGLGDNFIKASIQDNEGNIWFGTYSNGLTGIIDEPFVFYNFKPRGFNNDILSVTYGDNAYWLGSRKSIIKVDAHNNQNQTEYTERNGIPADVMISSHYSHNTLWLGTERSGIYKFDTKSGRAVPFFKTANSIENRINTIRNIGDDLWVATTGGVFKVSAITGKALLHLSTDNGLPHNKINSLFVDSKHNVWIATKSNGIISVNTDKRFHIDGVGELEFTCIAEDKNGDIWAATYGDGLFKFNSDTFNLVNENSGLKSNYCYSITCDNDGNLWAGHRLALSKIDPLNLKVLTYGTEIGISGDCNTNALFKDEQGTLRFGTTDGLIQYNYQKNRLKQAPPSSMILNVKVNDKEVDFDGALLLPAGKYRIKIDYIGINYRSPQSVKYQYKLDGWETEWSEFTSNTSVYYPRVDDGKFTFLLKAYNAEGVTSEEPLQLEISINPPLWKRWWFIVLAFIMVAGILYLIIFIREKRQIEFQKYLQRLLDERTREVVEQKEELEVKNRDITDSINYAQRIQNSILPSVRRLQENFSGSFTFYQPRDIVSGDFYWFDKVSDNKFIIVVADSTGHGVPGALMSMIGTTLIKDICNRPDVVSPMDILLKLDEEMERTLNQNTEAIKSSDGMDIIACEINFETYVVKIASAMRPVIIYQNGEQVYVSGSKNSIGGNEYEDEVKCFENKVYQMQKGDLIFMFSDGYPDQFGGPMGKKFKMVRLRNLLRDFHHLPMEEQYEHVKSTFNLWKDTLDQIDDVLFMGIRL